MWGLGAQQCQAIIDREQCGLEHRHADDHVPFVPGEYLPPPMLHPLDVLLLVRRRLPRCPACGVLPSVVEIDTQVTHAFRHFEDGAWGEPELEIEWRFDPCGHEAREVLPQAATNAHSA